MGLVILAAMIGIPLIEIAVFIQVGDLIGLLPTLAVVIITAMTGTALLRHQGLATLRKAQESLAAGRMPLHEVFDGLCLMLAGALLLTPGFVTDAVGLILFVPAVRVVLRRLVTRYMVATGRIHVETTGFEGGPARRDPDRRVIEGDYEDITRDDDRR